ncbi:MAG: hypothetical protein JXP48_12195 [Acidobacteria bacterium]|nr:hypothetical protein [Acidobacteriota bacterium]
MKAGLLGTLLLLLALAPPPGAASEEAREWLVLVYVNALNDRGLDGSARALIQALEKGAPGDRAAVVVRHGILEKGAGGELQFPRTLTTVLLQQDPGGQAGAPPAPDSSPIQDMAGENALYTFARRSIAHYPAAKIALLYFGRGEGLGGLGRDDLSGHTMSVPDFARALARIRAATGKRIDLLVVDADFVQTAEAVHEWRDGADIIVGTAGKSPRLGYLYELAIGDLAADPAMDAAELAGAFVYYAENRVTSAVKTEGIPAFIERIDRWVTAVTGDPEAMKAAREAVGRTYAYDSKGCRDLYEFVARVGEALPEGHPARDAGLELQDHLEQELLLSRSRHFPERAAGDPRAGAEYERAAGLGIYLPERIYDSARYEPLAFASASKWRGFLLALLD